MTDFQLSSLRNASVWGLYRLKSWVEMDPVSQREGDIWNLEKRQLLIDTIVNQFDVPKIYVHKFPQPLERNGKTYDYAVIDGKQRLTAIWAFIDGEFPLADDFVFMGGEDGDTKVDAAALTYADLARKYPNLKTDFDSYALDVVCIETNDPELIEELFSRLNEAVPLSAPEKRNALPGPLPPAVRSLSQHRFFMAKLPFSNRRYRHYDLAAKLLMSVARDDIVDTKKVYLDEFFRTGSKLHQNIVESHILEIRTVIDVMSGVFVDDDPLLRQIGMVVLYFHVFRRGLREGKQNLLHREDFIKFDDFRKRNRLATEVNIATGDYKLLEFDRYTQSPNDAFAMKIRLLVIDEAAFGGQLGFSNASG